MADLGSWLTGAYRISRALDEEDLDEGIPRGAVGEPDADSGRLQGLQDRRREGDDAPPPDIGGRGRGPRNRRTQGKSGGERKSGTKIN
jgi:hypothetical protein